MSKTLTPLGARVYVIDDPVIVEEVERAAAAGLHVVVDKKNIPRPTSGIVVAVGSDPLLQDLVQVGDRIFFSKYCTEYIISEGKSYHSLDIKDIIGVEREQQQNSDSSTTPQLSPREEKGCQ